MTPTQAKNRIIIAKDVIAQIQANKLIVMGGTYIGFESDDAFSTIVNYSANKCITKDEIKKIRSNCSVCAKGALFLSRVDKLNKIQHKDFSDCDDEICENLSDVFDRKTLDLIESCFEGWDYYDSAIRNYVYYDHWNNISDPADRLMAICQNIIDNKGEFIPDQEYEIVNT